MQKTTVFIDSQTYFNTPFTSYQIVKKAYSIDSSGLSVQTVPPAVLVECEENSVQEASVFHFSPNPFTSILQVFSCASQNWAVLINKNVKYIFFSQLTKLHVLYKLFFNEVQFRKINFLV